MRRCIEGKNERILDSDLITLPEAVIEGGDVTADDKCLPDACEPGV